MTACPHSGPGFTGKGLICRTEPRPGSLMGGLCSLLCLTMERTLSRAPDSSDVYKSSSQESCSVSAGSLFICFIARKQTRSLRYWVPRGCGQFHSRLIAFLCAALRSHAYKTTFDNVQTSKREIRGRNPVLPRVGTCWRCWQPSD